MEINNATKKEEKQGDIIVLDEGITKNNIIEPLSWLCCIQTFFPYRLV
jgi:hypothetical protein